MREGFQALLLIALFVSCTSEGFGSESSDEQTASEFAGNSASSSSSNAASMSRSISSSSSSSSSMSSSRRESDSSQGYVGQDVGSSDDNRMHPAHEDFNECQYVGEWGDCDPFKMIRIKEERLVVGESHCEETRNITKPCSRDELPPGTLWLIEEHKVC